MVTIAALLEEHACEHHWDERTQRFALTSFLQRIQDDAGFAATVAKDCAFEFGEHLDQITTDHPHGHIRSRDVLKAVAGVVNGSGRRRGDRTLFGATKHKATLPLNEGSIVDSDIRQTDGTVERLVVTISIPQSTLTELRYAIEHPPYDGAPSDHTIWEQTARFRDGVSIVVSAVTGQPHGRLRIELRDSRGRRKARSQMSTIEVGELCEYELDGTSHAVCLDSIRTDAPLL